ncbi:MAG: flippase-like domain-containing protein [Bacteroidetes bacterium]|nr:flippase-like domain-containing protein [Bacteroidota bacterium]
MNKGKNKTKSFVTIIISLVFAIVFMWLAVRGLEFEKIIDSMKNANYFWILAASAFGIAAYWFRAVRWNLLLEPLGHRISNSNALWTISFGYLMNLTIPRSGELARSTALFGVEKIPVDQSFGTIILERVIDLVCMLFFLALTLFFKYDAIAAFYQKSGFRFNPSYLIGFLLFFALGSFVFFKFKSRFLHIPILAKIIHFIDGIFQGLTSIFRLKQKAKFLMYTIGIWLSYYFAAYLVCFALPETSHFGIADGFFIIVVGTLGMMIPASGGIGAFHFALKIGIGALFISLGKSFEEGAAIGLSYAFLSHTMQMVIMLIMGLISIPILAKARTKA